jgi:hypothetical protein
MAEAPWRRAAKQVRIDGRGDDHDRAGSEAVEEPLQPGELRAIGGLELVVHQDEVDRTAQGVLQRRALAGALGHDPEVVAGLDEDAQGGAVKGVVAAKQTFFCSWERAARESSCASAQGKGDRGDGACWLEVVRRCGPRSRSDIPLCRLPLHSRSGAGVADR